MEWFHSCPYNSADSERKSHTAEGASRIPVLVLCVLRVLWNVVVCLQLIKFGSALQFIFASALKSCRE